MKVERDFITGWRKVQEKVSTGPVQLIRRKCHAIKEPSSVVQRITLKALANGTAGDLATLSEFAM
jgi:hypothetical protein